MAKSPKEQFPAQYAYSARLRAARDVAVGLADRVDAIERKLELMTAMMGQQLTTPASKQRGKAA